MLHGGDQDAAWNLRIDHRLGINHGRTRRASKMDYYYLSNRLSKEVDKERSNSLDPFQGAKV